MKKSTILKLFLISLSIMVSNNSFAKTVAPAANGISFPSGLKNWRVIASSFRTDNDTQRVILGNSIAIKAARSGQVKRWPQGAILAKLVWKNTAHPQWDSAIVPGEFVHSEIMIKDSTKFASTGGWGYARWKGEKQQPYGDTASFAEECLSCHTKAKNSDYVFTIPAKTP